MTCEITTAKAMIEKYYINNLNILNNMMIRLRNIFIFIIIFPLIIQSSSSRLRNMSFGSIMFKMKVSYGPNIPICVVIEFK